MEMGVEGRGKGRWVRVCVCACVGAFACLCLDMFVHRCPHKCTGRRITN